MSLFARRPRTNARRHPESNTVRPQPLEALESRLLMDATVVLAQAGPTKVNFIDADGSKSSITLAGPGNVSIPLTGALTQTTKGKTVTVTGTALAASVGAIGTTTKTKLTISGKGGTNGRADVSNVIVTGSLKALNGKTAVIAGTINVGGAAGTVTLDSKAAGDVTAQSISKMTVTNTFATNLTTGALNTFKAGAIVGGTWLVNGATSSVTANSITGWAGTFHSLNKLAVKNEVTGSTLRAAGDVGTVQAKTLANSNVYAGLATLAAGSLPASQADFSAQATIKTVKLKNLSAGSNIAAFAMNNVTLGTVESVAAPRFGVAAQQIKSLTATVSSKKLKLKNVALQSEVDAAFAAAAIPPQGFVVLVV